MGVLMRAMPYRDNMPSGDSRADLFSVGGNVLIYRCLPRTDKISKLQLLLQIQRLLKTEKLLLTKQMISVFRKRTKTA